MRSLATAALAASLLAAVPAARADGPAAPTHGSEPPDPQTLHEPHQAPPPEPSQPEPPKPKRHPILPEQQPATGEEFIGDIIGNILLAPLLEPATVPPPAPPIPANDLAPDPAAGMPESPLDEAPAPRQSFYDLHTGLTADLGYSFGGQDLIQPGFAGTYARTDTTLHAGEGLQLGVSWVQRFGASRFGLKAGLDYTFNGDCNLGGSNSVTGNDACRYRFWHGGQDIMGLYALGDEDAPWRTLFGAGLTVQYTPVFTARGDAPHSRELETDFDSAIGLMVQLQWKSYSLRYTHITYHASSTGATVDGSGFGVFFSFQFW